MVATVDLRSTCESVSDDVSGLWTYLQQLVGQPFLFFRQSYGDRAYALISVPRMRRLLPKLRRRIRGSYVLTLRGSIWSLLSGPHSELNCSRRPASDARAITVWQPVEYTLEKDSRTV